MTIDLMRDWRQTPFEREGAMRHGIRSALCMEGHGWTRSDNTAADVVSAALRILGAERPTLEEGQRYYTYPRENCRWCYGLLDLDDMAGNRNRLFCSDHCRAAAYVQWDLGGSARRDAMSSEAYRAVYRERFTFRECEACKKAYKPARAAASTRFCSLGCFARSLRVEIDERPCQHCGLRFVPHVNNLQAKFCGRDCADAGKRIHQVKPCQMCGTSFLPRTKTNLFCSVSCSRNFSRVREVERRCSYCAVSFVAKRGDAQYCSAACTRFADRIKSGRVKRISPPVFDYIFKAAA